MGLFSFIKGAGPKLFGKKELEAPKEEAVKLQAYALLTHINQLGLPYKKLSLIVEGSKVSATGEVDHQLDAEKIVLALGNVEGIESVDNNLVVATPKPQAQFHTVVSGDTLSKIAQKFYGSANKFPVIFEANKPMLTHPDKIYPGQVLRIPQED
jgi:nucleoid-associated protein YgaU